MWLTHAEDFGLHPFNNPVTVMPNHWATWSRFKNGRPLPTRNDERGNPPIVFDVIKFDQGVGKYYGCWHDPDRRSLSGADDDPYCEQMAGGGYTLFLDVWCYFGMEPPEE